MAGQMDVLLAPKMEEEDEAREEDDEGAMVSARARAEA